MKKIILAVVLAMLGLLMLTAPVLADPPDEGMDVDIVVIGDEPVITLVADGAGVTVFINGRNINDPLAYYFENTYNDADLQLKIDELRAMLETVGFTLNITEDGLSKVILVIEAQAQNMSNLLEQANQNEVASVGRDNELWQMLEELDSYLSWLVETELGLVKGELTEAILDLSTSLEEAKDEYNTTLCYLAGILGGLVLVLMVVIVIIRRKN